MGIHINRINQANIIIIAIYITFFVFSQLPVPNDIPVLLASNLIHIPKHRRFLMRGHQMSLCKHHILRTSCHPNMELVPYQRKHSHKSTGRFLTVNQYFSQQSAWSSNQPAVKLSQLVCKVMTRQFCSIFLSCKRLEH